MAVFQETERTITITIIPKLGITSDTAPSCVEADSYPAMQLVATGGVGPYTWSLATDAEGNVKCPLPDGLTLSPDGVISGTPTKPVEKMPTVFKARDSGAS